MGWRCEALGFWNRKAKTIPATMTKQVVGVPFLPRSRSLWKGHRSCRISTVSDWHELPFGSNCARRPWKTSRNSIVGSPKTLCFNPAIGSDAERILSRMMAHCPEDRFQTAEEVVQAWKNTCIPKVRMTNENYGTTWTTLSTEEKRRILPEVSEKPYCRIARQRFETRPDRMD